MDDVAYGAVPPLVLNNGQRIPILGFDTFNLESNDILTALKIGYNYFDCAFVYQNEKDIGKVFEEEIKKGAIKRDNLFISSKLWNTFHRPNLVRKACEMTLQNLRLTYIDMYLMHWPMGYKEGADLNPKDSAGKILQSDVDYLDTWCEMEKLVDARLCKSIGVCNFNKKQIERLLAKCRIKPVTIQIECHPYLNQKPLIAFCRLKNITVSVINCLGSRNRSALRLADPEILEDLTVLGIAAKHKKTASQILIHYQIQRGNIVIPKALDKMEMASNFEVFDFTLPRNDMIAIDELNCDLRFVRAELARKHPHHPFEHDEY